MRSINEFANQLNRSYATAENAQKAFNKFEADEEKGGHLILQRDDGRFVNIVVNPDPMFMLQFAHNGVGVWS